MPIVVPGTGPTASTTGGTAGVTGLGVSTQITTKPGIFAAAITETQWPYTVDVSNYLATTDTISSVTSTLVLASTGAILNSSWRNSTTVSGNIITINMNIAMLQLGQIYQIIVHFTASAIKAPTFSSIIEVTA
jgi:hypothetical protein